jgi:hypothetical protein
MLPLLDDLARFVKSFGLAKFSRKVLDLYEDSKGFR